METKWHGGAELKVSGSNSNCRHRPFCMEFVCYPGPSRCSRFFPPSKDTHARLTGNSKLAIDVNVSGKVCLSPFVIPVIDWLNIYLLNLIYIFLIII